MIPDKFNNIERCKNSKSPVLFIHGADDEIVNVKHTEILFDRYFIYLLKFTRNDKR
jgi:dipeptidyl aminopeptidase/acylaminoacyl peptidase